LGGAQGRVKGEGEGEGGGEESLASGRGPAQNGARAMLCCLPGRNRDG